MMAMSGCVLELGASLTLKEVVLSRSLLFCTSVRPVDVVVVVVVVVVFVGR